MAQKIFKHNPSFLSEEELADQFVIRHKELNLILEAIRGNTGPVNEHLLVVGPRGMGKTMLMRRVALALHDDPELAAHWQPVLLPEEIYTVATEGELWLKTLGYIQPDQQDQDRWRAILEALQGERDDARLCTQALARLRETAQTRGQRLIVMVENLNTLIGEQAHVDTGWNLRKTLLNEPAIMLLATATVRFDEIENAGKSMFELFREIKLMPIPTEECITLWRAIAGETLDAAKVRPLQILTGGNPRLLTILASFAGGASFSKLMQDLIVLIDDHTTYFKANVELLPALERKIYATLAEIWSPAGAREVAHQARLNVSKTSAQLKRLVSRGAVTEVGRKGRKIYYQVAERLYNIYHLMRQSSTAAERAKAVVEFMVRFYDLEYLGGCIAQEACAIQGQEKLIYIGAYRHLLSKHARNNTDRERLLASTPQVFLEIPEVRQSLTSDTQADTIEMPATKGENIHEAEAESETAQEAQALLQQSEEAFQKKPEDAIVILDQVIERFISDDDPGIVKLIVNALFNKGVALKTMERSEEAIVAYDDMVYRYGDRTEVPIAKQVARALVNKGVTLGTMERPEVEIATYDDVVYRYGDRTEVPIVEQVARALVNKGVTLRTMENPEEAIVAYDDVVRRYGDRIEALIAEQVARALVNKGYALGTMERPEEEIVAYDDVVYRYGDRIEAPIVEQVARALVNKGVTLRTMENPEEAIVAYDEVVRRYGDRTEVPIAEQVARALLQKGILLAKSGHHEEAISSFDLVIKETDGRAVSATSLCHVGAIVEKSLVLIRMKQIMEATHAFSKLFVRDDLLSECFHPVMDRIIDFLARGYEEEVLQLLTQTPAKTKLEPLVVAIRMILEQEFNAPQEVVEVAKDVVKRIEEERADLGSDRNIQ